MPSTSLAAFLLLAASAAFGQNPSAPAAACVDGKWTGDIPGAAGKTLPITFTFKTVGRVLTGTIAGDNGRGSPITQAAVTGDKIQFVQMVMPPGGDDVDTFFLVYKGVIKGDTMEFMRTGDLNSKTKFTVKRVGGAAAPCQAPAAPQK
jgi:hypothetical protein